MGKPKSVHMGGPQEHIGLPLQHTRSPHHIYRCNSNFELIGFCDASYGTSNNPEKAGSTSGSMYFLSRGDMHFSTSMRFSTNIQKVVNIFAFARVVEIECK